MLVHTRAHTCTQMARVHACTCRRVPRPCTEHRLQVASVSGRVADRVSVEKEAGVCLCGPWTEGRPEEGMEGAAHLLLLRKAVDSWKPVQTEPSCVSRPQLGLTLGAWRPGWVGRGCHFLYFWDALPFFFFFLAKCTYTLIKREQARRKLIQRSHGCCWAGWVRPGMGCIHGPLPCHPGEGQPQQSLLRRGHKPLPLLTRLARVHLPGQGPLAVGGTYPGGGGCSPGGVLAPA